MITRTHSTGTAQKMFLAGIAVVAFLAILLFPDFSNAQSPDRQRLQLRDPSLHTTIADWPERDQERERQQLQELDRIRDRLCADDAIHCERFRTLDQERVRRMEQLEQQNRLSPLLQRMEMRRLHRLLRWEGLAINLSVRLSSTFTVNLPSNPSTGYAWEASFDEKHLSLSENTYVPPASQMLGASGEQLFRFKALVEGTTFVTFRYVRSWEEGVSPADMRLYVVTVR